MVSDIADYASVGTVLREILSAVPSPRSEVLFAEDAYGRVASEDVLAPEDVPAGNASLMDGFAVRSRDTADASESHACLLPVVGEVALGEQPSVQVRGPAAIRVSTGSLLPSWADAVVPVENTSVTESGVALRTPVGQGNFVYEAGSDARKGAVAIRRGETIRAQEVGLALTIGVRRIRVFKKPTVAILATGNELVDSSVRVRKTGMKNSHAPVFVRLIRQLGCEPLSLGIAPDDRRMIRAGIGKGLAKADLVLTTGGTSMGMLDLVGGVVASFGPRKMFHGVKMDRGRVTGVALVGHKPIVMMPGPIQGATNAFLLFGVPIMRKLSGVVGGEALVRAKLTTPWAARARFPNFTKVAYVSVSRGTDGAKAEIVTGESESMSLLTRANGFVVVPEETVSLPEGSEVNVLLLPGFSFA